MRFNAFHGIKPFSQLIFALFVILVSFLIFMAVSMVIAVPLFGLDSFFGGFVIADFNDPESLRIIKYFQVVQSVGLFIVPSVILAWLYHGAVSEYLFLKKKTTYVSLFLAAVLMIAALPFVNFLGEWNSRMRLPEFLSELERWMKNAEESAAALTEAFLKVETTGGLLFNLFMIALLPAVGEEFLFRGVVQRIFTRWTNSHQWGIWIAAVLFSALHMQFYGFIPRLLLGVLFGYLLVWSGSMWLPVAAHFFNNAFAVTAMFLIDKNVLNPSLEDIGATPDSKYAVLFSLALMFILIFAIRKDNRGKELKIKEQQDSN